MPTVVEAKVVGQPRVIEQPTVQATVVQPSAVVVNTQPGGIGQRPPPV